MKGTGGVAPVRSTSRAAACEGDWHSWLECARAMRVYVLQELWLLLFIARRRACRLTQHQAG